MKSPDVIIAGEFRCGSTSLFECLIKHSQIEPPKMGSDNKFKYHGSKLYLRQKEIRFFDRYWDNGVNWYKNLFKENSIAIDASTSYLYNDLALKRIHQTFPNTKIIILIRNPIYRLNSHFNHLQEINEEFRKQYESLDDFVNKELHNDHELIKRGVYIKSLEKYFKLFTKKQTLVIKSEDLFHLSARIIKQIIDFIGIDNEELEYKNFRKTKSKPLSDNTKIKLENYYKNFNIELYNLLGRNMEW